MMKRKAAKFAEVWVLSLSCHYGGLIYGVWEWKDVPTVFSGLNVNYVVKCFQT